MVSLSFLQRPGPIAVDLGTRSVKLVQMSADRSRIVESVRWDLPHEPPADTEELAQRWTKAIIEAREGRRFKGNEAVICLGARELNIQNIRVVKPQTGEVEPLVLKELAERAPFPIAETEIRLLETADVRQGDTIRREVIVLGCQRILLERYLKVLIDAGLKPTAVDIEPQSLLRCYNAQYRRDEDRRARSIVVHVGHSNTAVVIAEGDDILFLKYIDLGGKHFDEAVARHLRMDLAAAWALRRNNGDRRAEQQDAEVVRSINESIRPVVDKLANEVSLCVRYHSVTFRGQPLARLVLGGGEATQSLVERLAGRIDLKCELGDPFRAYQVEQMSGRRSQWDVAVGMAMRLPEKTS
jgi:type IV pilus assembly protein PilM